ncbi:hypothetical protein F2Q69_00030373 [Brassica cretica]|uniref:Dolichyl-diphosphooligosaccharide--protein glycosyltransferase subunit DAD1 n=1 Tax=Brassica cretica TaxID=69181 RepID=A0A8S9S3C8_BRACR|nr:hypothetical protein F2Q69_00030373 [Brassica cretica]
MVKSTSKDAQDLFRSIHSAYSATPTNLKIIDLYVVFAVFTALIQVAYMALVGSFPFNSSLEFSLVSGQQFLLPKSTINIVSVIIISFLHCTFNPSCFKYLQDLAPERAFADFVLCNLVLHLVIINFLG